MSHRPDPSGSGRGGPPVPGGAVRRALLAALLGALGSAATAQSDGWYELDTAAPGEARASASPSSTAVVPALGPGADAPGGVGGAGGGRAGDRLWMTRPGDTLEAIARETTGSAANARAIAAYNGFEPDAVPDSERLLFVPASLLPAPGTRAAPVESEIREFGPEGSGGIGTSGGTEASGGVGTSGVEARASDGGGEPAPPAPVATRNIDLFAGEVRVLGTVDVTRVAVGNGALIRAEVLDGGELLVIGQAPGSTSLRLWNKDASQLDYNIRVSESDPVTRVRMERMVRMRVRMVEFRKSALGRLGIDWSDAVNGPAFATAGDALGNALFRPAADGFSGLPNVVQPFSTYFGIATNITSRINLLASNGDAVTLAEPVLTSANGGTASFLAGGEVPYPSVGANGQTSVEFKEYGIKLDVAPVIDEAGNVRTAVSTEISQLDPAVSVGGAPGLLTRRAQTQVNVRSGETIVISGLLSAESGRDVDRIPGIGRLPVIGSLFRSKNMRNAVTELVIFVTPEVIEPSGGALVSERDRAVLDASTARLDRARDTIPLME